MAEQADDRPWMKVPALTAWDIAPGVGAEVTYRGRSATVVRVVSPGQIRGEVDLVMVDGSGSDLHRSVVHDVANGWCWPGEPPPADPTPADRLREAQALGLFVPAIGSTISLVCALPKSIRGITYRGVPARVEAVHDVIHGPRWSSFCEAFRSTQVSQRSQFEAGWKPSDYRIVLAATVKRDADLAGLEGIEADQRFALVDGPLLAVTGSAFESAPRPVCEGWAPATFREVVIRNSQWPFIDRPCERCGARGLAHGNDRMVRFFVEAHAYGQSIHSMNPEFFARVCLKCAEDIGQFACRPIPPRPEPVEAAAPRPTQEELDDTDFGDEEDGDGA